MENVSLASKEHCRSSRKSKMKRLNDNINQKNVSSHLSVLHIPQMSEKALKRWYEARDAYLGDQYSYAQTHRRIKQKNKITKHKETAPIFMPAADRFSRTDLQCLPVEHEEEKTQVIHDHFDDKCVGTEIDGSILFQTDIEQIDQGIQADLPSPQPELHHEYDTNTVEDEEEQQIQFDEESIEYNDKATETDLILNIETENEVDRQSTKENEVDRQSTVENEVDGQSTKENEVDRQITEETVIDSIPNVSSQIVPINHDDTTTILSSNESNTSIHEHLQRLRLRFKRLSKERRLLSCLLILYLIIMFGLLIVIFMLLWTYQGRSLILYRDVTITNTNIIDGVARYGESCNNDTDCKRPFICYKKRSSSSGICRCPLKSDFLNNQCIGDLNAVCTKDTDCQRYMLCSGMDDGTRRCHCQTLYNYDIERKQCRGDYHAPCQSHTDCRANLICNKTTVPSLCSCQINYRYYPLVRKCRGDPGAICEQATAECIDNAECRDGACECAFQFVPDEKKTCVDPCPKKALTRVRIRYPGDCRRFIDCQQRSKTECPEMTIFNFRTQLCDYPRNVLDCR